MPARKGTRSCGTQSQPPATGLDGEDMSAVLQWTAFLFWGRNTEVVLKEFTLAVDKGKGGVGTVLG